MREAEYQRHLIKKFNATWDRCLVLKNDSGYLQGIPDLTVFLPPGLAVILEVKVSADAPYEPNQEYYLELLDRLGFFSATIYPENEEEVFHAIQLASRTRG